MTSVQKPERSGAIAKRITGRRRVLRLWLLAVGIVLGAILAEFAVRLYVFSRGWTNNCYVSAVTLLVPDAQNGYTLARNYRFESGVRRISTDSHGFRNTALTAKKLEGTRRIAILGGSSVFGYLVSDGEEAASLLEKQLAESGHRTEVINAGVPGYNLIQTRRRFQQIVTPLQPDVVILYLGWNDLLYLLDPNPLPETAGVGPCAATWERFAAHSTLYGLVVHRLFGRTPEFTPSGFQTDTFTAAGRKLFLNTLQALVTEIRHSGVRLIICSQATLAHPNVSRADSRHLYADSRGAERIVKLGTALRDMLETFSTENSIEFVDVFNSIPPNTEMLGDDIHLTPAGEKRLADILHSYLVQHWADR